MKLHYLNSHVSGSWAFLLEEKFVFLEMAKKFMKHLETIFVQETLQTLKNGTTFLILSFTCFQKD